MVTALHPHLQILREKLIELGIEPEVKTLGNHSLLIPLTSENRRILSEATSERRYPHYKQKFEYFIRKYVLDLVVANNRAMKALENKGWDDVPIKRRIVSDFFVLEHLTESGAIRISPK